MEVDTRLRPELCNCLALRQAARHVTEVLLAGLESARTGRVVEVASRAEAGA